MTNGGVNFSLLPYKSYSVYLYAFAENATQSTYKYKCLASKAFKTPKRGTGTLTFYAHYVEDMQDTNVVFDPQYFWEINDTSNFGLSACSLPKASARDWDIDDETEPKYYAFGASTHYYSYTKPPVKFTADTNC